MKKVFLMLAAALGLICSCDKNNEGGETTPLNANFTITPEKVFVGDAVSFEADVTGGKAPYTYKWTVGGTVQEKTTKTLVYTFAKNGSSVVILDVTDAKGNTAQKKKAVIVDAAKIAETGELTVNWVGKMMGYNTKSAAAVANDGSVYSTCQNNKLYKWSANGESVWVKDIFVRKANQKSFTSGTPSIDTDGTIYIGAGSHTSDGNVSSDGTLKAFNPSDGSVKWTFTEWWRSDGTTPAPTCQGPIVAIDASTVYFGCTGQNGIVFSADKATGARKGFLAPAGGARSGILLSKSGLVHWYGGKYGVFGIEKSILDAGGVDKLTEKWRTFGSGDEGAVNNYEGQIACTKVGGEDCVAGIVTDALGTKVYAVKASDGEKVCAVYIEDTNAQDQGGVVIDKDGNIVASLNNTVGQDNGGIAIVNPSTQEIVARFRTQEKVSGSPAIDKAGNIHFGTESGYYYIVKLSGSKCELLVKRNLAELVVADSRYASSFGAMSTAKIWCSPVIGDDGKMYICFTDNDSREFGGVACLSYEGCTGPGETEWPMIGHDRRHTCKQ